MVGEYGNLKLSRMGFCIECKKGAITNDTNFDIYNWLLYFMKQNLD